MLIFFSPIEFLISYRCTASASRLTKALQFFRRWRLNRTGWKKERNREDVVGVAGGKRGPKTEEEEVFRGGRQNKSDRELDRQEAERGRLFCQDNIWQGLLFSVLARVLEMGDTGCLPLCVHVCVWACGHWSLEIIVRGEAKLTTAAGIQTTWHWFIFDSSLIPFPTPLTLRHTCTHTRSVISQRDWYKSCHSFSRAVGLLLSPWWHGDRAPSSPDTLVNTHINLCANTQDLWICT